MIMMMIKMHLLLHTQYVIIQAKTQTVPKREQQLHHKHQRQLQQP
jgi:hypothetical protein